MLKLQTRRPPTDPSQEPKICRLRPSTSRQRDESLTLGRGGGVVTQGNLPEQTAPGRRVVATPAATRAVAWSEPAGRALCGQRQAEATGTTKVRIPRSQGGKIVNGQCRRYPQPLHGAGVGAARILGGSSAGTCGDRYTDLEGHIWCGSWVAAGWRPGSRMAEMPEHVRWLDEAGRFWLLSGGSRVDVVGLPGDLSRTPSAAAAAASGRRSLPRASGLPVPALGPHWPA